MLNSDFLNEQASSSPTRLENARPATTSAAQVRLALRLATAREPTADEVAPRRGLHRHACTAEHEADRRSGAEAVLPVALNLNEFVYLD